VILEYTYWFNTDTCLHRLGSKRLVGNYSDDEVKELSESGRDSYVDDSYCLDDIPHRYDSLDRFRLSDGSEM